MRDDLICSVVVLNLDALSCIVMSFYSLKNKVFDYGLDDCLLGSI